MKIAIASDHAGFQEKERLKPLLTELGIQFEDLGTGSVESVDYPDYARKVAEKVARGEAEQGVLVCGSGTGMAIAANKIKGVRAAVCHDATMARYSRQHNGANVLSLGSTLIDQNAAIEIVDIWLNTPMKEPRYIRRLAKIRALEE